MDFLDPKKERRNRLMLLLGYCLVALAIGLVGLILLYQAIGYDIDRQGKVTQNGFVFVSSQPSGASVYLNNKLQTDTTNTRLTVSSGSYNLKLTKAGYRSWSRPITVAGGDVQHFDYPFLFPTVLQTSSLADLQADPSVATQSPDKRWLLLGDPAAPGAFTEYDLKNTAKPVVSTVTLPSSVFTPSTGAQSWSLVEWVADNKQVLLLHTYVTTTGNAHEYILLNRDAPAASLNLTTNLRLDQNTVLSLFNNRADEFYEYSSTDKSLQRVSGKDGVVVSRLDHILAYKTYSDNKVLYVTDVSPTGKLLTNEVLAVLEDGQKTIGLKTLPAGATYVLNLASYSGDWYVAIGASSDAAAYLFKNPQSQITSADTYPSPWRRIGISNLQSLSFSSGTQFLLIQGGQRFIVYDFENSARYQYTVADPIDRPQTKPIWMDGNRLMYVSGGKLIVFDYDYRNKQTLVAANPAYVPFFDHGYSYLYTLRGVSDASSAALTATPLTVKS